MNLSKRMLGLLAVGALVAPVAMAKSASGMSRTHAAPHRGAHGQFQKAKSAHRKVKGKVTGFGKRKSPKVNPAAEEAANEGIKVKKTRKSSAKTKSHSPPKEAA